jgi:hypothetical protein
MHSSHAFVFRPLFGSLKISGCAGVLSSPCESQFGFGLGFSCIGVLLGEVIPNLDRDLAVAGYLLVQVEGELGPQ